MKQLAMFNQEDATPICTTPPREALGAIADERIEMKGENSAKVYSSSRNKFYEVTYDPITNTIMANDNGSYWVGYLGYPSIAFLMKKGIIAYDLHVARAFTGIAWKDLNQKYNNDFEKVEKVIVKMIEEKGFEVKDIITEVDRIYSFVITLQIKHLGKKKRPPSGY